MLAVKALVCFNGGHLKRSKLYHFVADFLRCLGVKSAALQVMLFSTCARRGIRTSEFLVPVLFQCLAIFSRNGNGFSERSRRFRSVGKLKAIISTLKMKAVITIHVRNSFIHV